MKREYYKWTGLSLILLTAGSAAGVYFSNSMAVGTSVLASYFLYRQGVKTARMNGKTDASKVLHSLTINLIEFLSVFSVYFFSPAVLPVVFAASAIGFEASFHQMLKDKLMVNNAEMLGRAERVGILGLTLISGFFNEYLVFYGVLLAGSAAVIEAGRQLFLSLKK